MIQTPQPYPTPAPRTPEKVVLSTGCSISFAVEEGEAGSGELEAAGQGTADPGAAAAALWGEGQWVGGHHGVSIVLCHLLRKKWGDTTSAASAQGLPAAYSRGLMEDIASGGTRIWLGIIGSPASLGNCWLPYVPFSPTLHCPLEAQTQATGT